MPNLVPLPDGTVLILNGAFQGVAGFGLATDPNLNAVLYDPTQPFGSRFSILGSTIVARMYHSEAVLIPDGRVLVSGSDPQTDNADGTVKYPEEFRIEVKTKQFLFMLPVNLSIYQVYVPPYLTQGFTQPTFTLPNHDWAYNQVVTITNVHLFQGTTATMRISLVGG
jgi:hypothetical protein